jgi:hypothetical protein
VGAEHGAGGGPLFLGHRQQEMFGAHIGVVQLLRLGVRPIEDPLDLAAEAGLGPAPRLSGESGDLPIHLLADRGDIEPRLLQERLHHPLVLDQQGSQEMGIIHHRIPPGPGQLPGIAECLLGFYRQSLWTYHRFLTCNTFNRPSGYPEVPVIGTLEPTSAMARGIPAYSAGLTAFGDHWARYWASDGGRTQ